MKKRRAHINAVKATIDEYFSEAIPRENVSENDVLISMQSRIDGIEYVFRKIDTRNKEALKKIAEEKLKRFLAAHSDNTFKLFVDLEIEKAEDNQSYFPKYKTDSEHKSYFFILERWIVFLKEDFGKIDFIREGKQVKSSYDFFTEIGMTAQLKKKYGIIINPTHNFEKLKEVREELYDSDKNEFIEERSLDKVETGEFEILCFRFAWVKDELNVIDTWMNPKPVEKGKTSKPSTSNQIELLKYQHHIKSEIEKIDRIFNINPFDKIFEKAILYGAIEKPVNEGHKAAMHSEYNFNFNIWLQEKKGWKYGNPIQYNLLVTKENFMEYLAQENIKQSENEKEFNKEKESWQISNYPKTNKAKDKFSHKQIAIAFTILGIQITASNATEILKKHSELKSTQKLLSKRLVKPADLTKLSGIKTVDTKHLRDLEAAKRLISGTKFKNKIKDIDRIITAFQSSYNTKY